MSKMITSRQSKQARSLLKWNLHDVAGRCNILFNRLEKFERASIRLARNENEELRTVYEKHGLHFTSDFDVLLLSKEEDFENSSDINGQERISMDQSELEAATKHFEKEEEKKKEEEKDKLWVHTPEYSGPDRRTAANQLYYTGDEKRANRQNMVKKALEKNKK